METLLQDFTRFGKLHSWYKHIRIEGREFYFYQDIGEEPRNCIHPDVKDLTGMHWHFRSIHPEYPTEIPGKAYSKVRFGPFLGGIHSTYNNTKYIFSFHIVLMCNPDTFVPWIAKHYPEWAYITFDEWEQKIHTEDPIILELYERENQKYWDELVNATKTLTSSSPPLLLLQAKAEALPPLLSTPQPLP